MQLPEPTLRRLPWYLAYLGLLNQKGVEYISSTKISEELNVDSSQIAKDLSFLNIRGKTRIGYEVKALESKLRDFLGFACVHRAVMAGVFSLRDSGLQRNGRRISAGVDITPDLIGSTICGVTIHHPDKLPQLVKELDITIGIVAVPFESAQAMADTLADAGIRALWNFTPYRIRAREGVVITNTSIYSHLALIYNRLASQR